MVFPRPAPPMTNRICPFPDRAVSNAVCNSASSPARATKTVTDYTEDGAWVRNGGRRATTTGPDEEREDRAAEDGGGGRSEYGSARAKVIKGSQSSRAMSRHTANRVASSL